MFFVDNSPSEWHFRNSRLTNDCLQGKLESVGNAVIIISSSIFVFPDETNAFHIPFVRISFFPFCYLFSGALSLMVKFPFIYLLFKFLPYYYFLLLSRWSLEKRRLSKSYKRIPELTCFPTFSGCPHVIMMTLVLW